MDISLTPYFATLNNAMNTGVKIHFDIVISFPLDTHSRGGISGSYNSFIYNFSFLFLFSFPCGTGI
jgi:hypothetical protein